MTRPAPAFDRLPELLARALERGEAMLDLTRRQDWAALGEAEADQSRLLAEYFAAHPAIAAPGIAPVLRRLLELNDQAAQLTEQARLDCLRQLTDLQLGEHAQRAYTADYK